MAGKKYDESKPGARFIVLSGIFFTGVDSGLLSIEALRTSATSMIYAVALATATVATLAAMTRAARSATAPEADLPRTGPMWHESTLFTDPWYQIPAIYCVLMLFFRFVLDLVVTPPTTDRAVWFLASLGIASLAAAFGLVGADASKNSKKPPENQEVKPAVLDGEMDRGARGRVEAGTAGAAAAMDLAGAQGAALNPQHPSDPFVISDKAANSSEDGSAVGAVLRDPWFTMPAASVAFLHVARDGLETIEEDPGSALATVWLLMPVAMLIVGLVTTTVSQARQRRKEVKEQEETGIRRHTGEPASAIGTTGTSSGTVTSP